MHRDETELAGSLGVATAGDQHRADPVGGGVAGAPLDERLQRVNRAAGAVGERPNGVQGRRDALRLVDDDERAGRQRIDFATKRILGVAEERRLVGKSTQWAAPRLRQTVDLPTCLGPIVSAADLIEAAKKLDAARSR